MQTIGLQCQLAGDTHIHIADRTTQNDISSYSDFFTQSKSQQVIPIGYVIFRDDICCCRQLLLLLLCRMDRR